MFLDKFFNQEFAFSLKDFKIIHGLKKKSFLKNPDKYLAYLKNMAPGSIITRWCFIKFLLHVTHLKLSGLQGESNLHYIFLVWGEQPIAILKQVGGFSKWFYG